MPEWQDEGIILSNRPYGELHSVASILTKTHGRHAGLVQAGQSRKRLSALQPGCFVGLEWRARLEGQLGTCLLYTSPSPRDMRRSRMPSSA